MSLSSQHHDKTHSFPGTAGTGQPEKQCRICYDGDESDLSLGRLFKPCLCAGTISVSSLGLSRCKVAALLITLVRQYVHVKCLQKWRLSSRSNNAFWRCPQCRFHYRFARTKAYGLGTNPGRCRFSTPFDQFLAHVDSQLSSASYLLYFLSF